ncbi:hypothetical protein PHYBOEH_011807 [Phytophthora boehmeriae]|uniref:RxLR effector protein n=1 Tax=Phytophthora boehmeriae TaxID=109152 RepID=A0A8T1VHV4_9STRA|nr:hypothetical protein PHYBOEH_011807 [Phytophthora boehmeriae]
MQVLWMLMATFAACGITISTATTPYNNSVSHEPADNRFLRGDKETNKDEDLVTVNGEERITVKLRGALGLYNAKLKTSTFDMMIADDVFKSEMFSLWDKFKVPLKTIKRSMNPGTNTRFQPLFNAYGVRRSLKTKKATPESLIADMEANFFYRLSSEAKKKETEQLMLKYILDALGSF